MATKNPTPAAQKPPTPACPVRQRKQMAAPNGKVC